MDKYKKYDVPTKAKGEDQIKYLITRLGEDKKVLLEACKEAEKVIADLTDSKTFGTYQKIQQAINKAEGKKIK